MRDGHLSLGKKLVKRAEKVVVVHAYEMHCTVG